jgi:ribose transport system ATP-binding protein
VKNLSVAYQQIVEIAKALVYDVKILIMDEPSAALASNEIEHLFDLVKDLKAKGVTIIYVSHKMSEIFELADRITVLRDGRAITTVDADKTDRAELISFMVGRKLGESYLRKETIEEDVLLEVINLNIPGLLKDISFTLRKGEILGFAGLVGAGRTELARAIFGADPLESGEIKIQGKKIKVTNPNQAIKHGIGLVPEDRKQQGILAEMTVKENISYSSLNNLSRCSIINNSMELQTASRFGEQLNIKTPTLDAKVENLSGGNQQKVVLAKWLAARCKVLIFDEPTRGVDVAAKQEIYEMIKELADQGTGIIFISSEMPELIAMADRIIVVKDGAVVGSLSGQEVTQQAVLHLAMGD